MMKLNGAQILLGLTGAMFVVVGAIYLIDPPLMYSLYGEPLSGANAYHLVRTSAGGPLLVSGAALLCGAFKAGFRRHALWINLVMLSAFVLGRAWSLLADGPTPSMILRVEIVPEMVLALLTVYYLRRRTSIMSQDASERFRDTGR
ncbi:DUF4345 domain-containing protein [Sphingobium sp. DC-2]|uniref:DUF4345 domain-containing protein n=1 Tax=Sphingobium sp. DC-2 TaxID=1303256 RepID=UPI0004C40B2B|nr:DUF4345 domain-containing protein [Sphingobium sp. DC-2]